MSRSSMPQSRRPIQADDLGVADAADVATSEEAAPWLRREIWRSERELDQTKRALASAGAELDAMRASMSWKATAPLRIAARRFPRASRLMRRVVALQSAQGRADAITRTVRICRQATRATYWTLTLQLPRRLRVRRDVVNAPERRLDRRGEYRAWLDAYDTLDEGDFDAMRELVRSIGPAPLVSVLMPVFNSNERLLREAIDSVRAQIYENWELCVADDSSTEPQVRAVLDEYAQADDRIRVVYRSSNGGISAATNTALSVARGELTGFMDHDDLLRPHSLLLVVQAFVAGQDVALVYTDEDAIDDQGRPLRHFFKPDWNPALLLCQNCISHFSVFRTDLVRSVGGLRSEFDGSQDWDLTLRVTERVPAGGIVHVPHVLYHWRAVVSSAAANAGAKPYAIDAGRRAVEDHFERTGRQGYVTPVGMHQRVRFRVPSPQPLVSVVVPSTGRPELLEPCLVGLLRRTAYEELEVIVALSQDTASRDADREQLLAGLAADSRVRTLSLPQQSFNYAWTVNRAVALARGSLVLLLNDDTEVISEDWLETMVGHALPGDVGAVGSLLVFPDGTIQSAGMLVGAREVAEHLYHRRPLGISGYSGRARLSQDLSAIAATCMLVKREAFDDVGGLDEGFPVCYNDVDFCLRLRQRGWRVLVAPDAALRHHEMASFGSHQLGRQVEHDRDFDRIRERWGDALLDDRMHNPNLELDASDPSRLAFPPRTAYPWRITASSDVTLPSGARGRG